MSEKLTAHVRNTGRVWQVSIDGIDGSTLVPRPGAAAAMAAELAALHRGGSAADYDVTVQVQMPENYAEQWQDVQAHKRAAEAERQAWREGAHRLVTRMREDGLSQADVAASLGVAVQTVRTWEGLELEGANSADD